MTEFSEEFPRTPQESDSWLELSALQFTFKKVTSHACSALIFQQGLARNFSIIALFPPYLQDKVNAIKEIKREENPDLSDWERYMTMQNINLDSVSKLFELGHTDLPFN